MHCYAADMATNSPTFSDITALRASRRLFGRGRARAHHHEGDFTCPYAGFDVNSPASRRPTRQPLQNNLNDLT